MLHLDKILNEIIILEKKVIRQYLNLIFVAFNRAANELSTHPRLLWADLLDVIYYCQGCQMFFDRRVQRQLLSIVFLCLSTQAIASTTNERALLCTLTRTTLIRI